jgi:hypothetical protein
MLPLPLLLPFVCRTKFSCFFSAKISFLGLKASVVPFEGHIAVTQRDWQWRGPADWLIFS